MSTTTTVTIGHRDPRITYRGGWDHGGLWTGSAGESVSFSSTTDHNAFLSIDDLDCTPFILGLVQTLILLDIPGNISYYGFMQPSGGKISLCIDCRFFANSIHINAINPNSSPDAAPVVLYSGPTGGGSIIMTNRETLTLNASAPFSKLTLARFELTRGATPSSTSSYVKPYPSSSTPSTAANSSHSSNDPSFGQNHHTFPLGNILSGVLGGLAGISLLFFIFWHYVVSPRRQRNDTPPIHDDLISPFSGQQCCQPILSGRREIVGEKRRDLSHNLPSLAFVRPSKCGPTPRAPQPAMVVRGKGPSLGSTVTQIATQTIPSKFSGLTSTQSEVAAQHRPRKFDRV
ncbi:hypothetical protein BJ165DRAFT_1530355 [Panaeolus papilionaceus]|nr:hypothetical protein BJ165DRAFT_1530355 [Panaeolus papilionaceus]